MPSYVHSAFTIDLTNPFIQDMIIKNNIIGEYNDGDWPLEGEAKGESDFNLFYPSQYGSVSPNTHSVVGDPLFLDFDHWDFQLHPISPAIGIGDPSLGIQYDIDFSPRDSNAPNAGAFE